MTELLYKELDPEQSLSDFVKRFWSISNPTADTKQSTVLPDGYFDVLLKITANKLHTVSLVGICTQEIETTLAANTTIIGISFKPLAADYILQQKIADTLNTIQILPKETWNINKIPFTDFKVWTTEISNELHKILKQGKPVDERKQRLFHLLFQTKGALTVQNISQQLFWSSRQINRYFQANFGLSLKAYCNILRCKASYAGIKKGNLYPTHEFADQAHFIKEIKKHTGSTPKILSKNKNDRFIQFSTRPTE